YKQYLERAVAAPNCIEHVELVERANLYHFVGNVLSPFIKITASSPVFIPRIRGCIERGNANWKAMWPSDGTRTFDNLEYVLRFMVDTHITGMGWVEVPAGSYELVSQRERQSTCQIEAVVHYKDLIAH